MTDTPKYTPEIVELKLVRLSFPKLDKLEQKKDPRTGVARGKPKCDCTLLLDPSRADHQQYIAGLKRAAFNACIAKWGSKENFPKADPRTQMGGLIFPYGNGNDLKKVYAGYKDMFYLKTTNTQLPILGLRDGRQIRLLDDGAYHILDAEGRATPETAPPNQVPYGGCYVRARVSPFTYFPTPKNPDSANGVNFNIRVVQFMEPGQAFGGGAPLSAREELERMAGDAQPESAGKSDDPFGDDIPF